VVLGLTLILDRRIVGAGKAPLEKSLLVDVVEENVLTFADVLLEVYGLVDCAGEAIDQVILKKEPRLDGYKMGIK
jgi:hypothetical protein